MEPNKPDKGLKFTARCMKCGVHRTFEAIGHIDYRNRRRAVIGYCPVCDGKISRIIGMAPEEPVPPSSKDLGA